MKNFFKIAGITFVALFAIGSLTSTEADNTASAETTTKTQNSARSLVWFEGTGDVESTKKQFLEGDYEVEWETFNDCVYYADLSSGNDIFSADAALKNTTYLYGIPAGNHFVEVITGPSPKCSWFITFTPIN
jgi:hypothetical protein